jgi:hypothetical protein
MAEAVGGDRRHCATVALAEAGLIKSIALALDRSGSSAFKMNGGANYQRCQ